MKTLKRCLNTCYPRPAPVQMDALLEPKLSRKDILNLGGICRLFCQRRAWNNHRLQRATKQISLHIPEYWLLIHRGLGQPHASFFHSQVCFYLQWMLAGAELTSCSSFSASRSATLSVAFAVFSLCTAVVSSRFSAWFESALWEWRKMELHRIWLWGPND